MPKHLAGGKFTGSHTTVTDAAAAVAKIAEKRVEVTKIVLGRIERKANRQRRLKFKEVTAGWEVSVIDNASIQTIFVYTTHKEQTKAALEAAWPL